MLSSIWWRSRNYYITTALVFVLRILRVHLLLRRQLSHWQHRLNRDNQLCSVGSVGDKLVLLLKLFDAFNNFDSVQAQFDAKIVFQVEVGHMVNNLTVYANFLYKFVRSLVAREGSYQTFCHTGAVLASY